MTHPLPYMNAFARADRFLARDGVWIAVIVAVLGLQASLIWSHEPWADELQAVLLALEAPDTATLLAWLRFEGHPPAWYGLLQGLALLVPFTMVLPAAATVCAVFMQGAILFASPFTRLERALLASSQYVLFEFLTISRGTSLGAALMTLALVFWKSRWLWAIMAVLPMVDFLFGVISGVFLVLKWREGELWGPGVAAWIAGSVFAGWSVLPPPDMVSASEAMNMAKGVGLWFTQVGSLPFPFQGGIAPQWNTPVSPIAPVAWIAMLWLCWHLTRGFVWHRLMIFGFFGFTLVFSLVVYPIGLRHLMLGGWLLIGLVWLQRRSSPETAPQTRRVWCLWLIALTVSGVATAGLSTSQGFDSAGRAMAEIERRGLTDKRWVALPEWRAPAIAGRSQIAFERLGEGCRFRFVRCDHAYDALASSEAFTAALKADIAQNGRGYLLSDMEFTGFDPEVIAPIAFIERGYNGIDYHLYVIGRNSSEKSGAPPFCHSAKGGTLLRHSLGKK